MKQRSLRCVWKTYVEKSRKHLCIKALAVSLSIVAATSFLPANRVAAAAKPYVSMRTTFKTLQVGQKNRMTLKNNTARWKIQKISTNDKSIAAVSGKTEKSFQIQGNAVGRTTVKAVLKTTSRKKHTSKTVKCRVNVIAADTETKPESQVPVTEAEVSTQEQLDQALLNSSLKKLTITSENATKFVIPEGTYPSVSLIVDTPVADIENSGVFQSIEIRAVKPDTWIEKAVGNMMRITAKAARIIVNPGAHVKEITFSQADADAKMEVNGKVDHIRIQSKIKLTVSGRPEADLSVSVDQAAADTQITSETKLDLSLRAAASLTFQKGAEGSSVNLSAENINAVISNLTSKLISVKKMNGTSSNVQAGQKDIRIFSNNIQNTGTSSGAGAWYGSGSSSGSGSNSSSGSGSGSGSSSDSKEPTNGIAAPTIEEIRKGIDINATIVVSGTTVQDAKVYWHTWMNLAKDDVVVNESQPDLKLQYKCSTERDWQSYGDGTHGVGVTFENDSFKLTGSSKQLVTLDSSFRYIDKEGNVGEEVSVVVQMWNEEITRKYVEYYLNHREADKQTEPFCMQMILKTLTVQDNKICMSYDEENLPYYMDLPELPQWTGDGPVIPEVIASEMLEKLSLDRAAVSIVISGASVSEITENKKGNVYCHIEVPMNVSIPEGLPGGKFEWKIDQLGWKDQEETDKKLNHTTSFWNLSDSSNTSQVMFRYQSAGGNFMNESQEDGNFMRSIIEIQLCNEAILDACINEIQQNISDQDGPVLRQYDFSGLRSVEAATGEEHPKVQLKEASAYTFSGKNIAELPSEWGEF